VCQPSLGANARLIAILQEGLPLCDRPFEQVGRVLGLGEDEVIEQLRHLLASGALTRLGPVYQAARVRRRPHLLDRQLIAATRGGLPLVPQPYEALGAMVGVSAAEIQERLAAMLASGRIRRIGAVTPQRARP